MTTIKVSLADAPTDVLVWLVGRGYEPAKMSVITEAVAPHGVERRWQTTRNAVGLLCEIGYAVKVGHDLWAATPEGHVAVHEATANKASDR